MIVQKREKLRTNRVQMGLIKHIKAARIFQSKPKVEPLINVTEDIFSLPDDQGKGAGKTDFHL